MHCAAWFRNLKRRKILSPAPLAATENLAAVLQASGLTMAVADTEKLRSVQLFTPAVVE